MNTQPKPKVSISARFLGPVFELDGELTKNSQNLIFARNGTGKSFLSRALRYFDQYGQGKDISDAARNLVSDESADGKGRFTLSRGSNVLGSLQLEKASETASASVSDTVFHVFSEDFVHEELREREYELDGEIENQIAVDSENIKLKDAQAALAGAQAAEQTAETSLRGQFDKLMLSELHEKAGVNKQLREYKALSLDEVLKKFADKPSIPEKSFADILRDLDSLKSIPSEPDYPESVNAVSTDDLDPDAIKASLKKITSPSSVSEAIKIKIDAHHEFFETGTKLVMEEHLSECPFCEQGLNATDTKAIIDAYVAYFSDEEEKHKSELRDFFRLLNRKESELKEIETRLTRQKARFDSLKAYLPSMKTVEIAEGEDLLKAANSAIIDLKQALEAKAGTLATEAPLPNSDLAAAMSAINELIEGNNTKVASLNKGVGKADDERKALQRDACAVFEQEFAISSWNKIEDLRKLGEAAKEKAAEVSALEKSNPSKNARDRVAETFDLLLREFFAEKYAFDKETFVLKRGSNEMTRGPHRTLSDGEKTAIAFCYFIASIHRKVTANSDYRKLFLVFDDPVTSMSYDFVFAIAQTLKNLNISDQGEVSINPGKIDGKKHLRPELLILTHSSYFFNISRTNRVVSDGATFSLYSEGSKHKLTRLRSYVAPFEQQLEHVFLVANGSDPDHGTGNAIRSVLEAIGRFCRPDKSDSLQDFIAFLTGEDGLPIKSILINSLCHGTYYDETPPPDDLKLACEEAVTVVEKYAIGHLEVIKSKSAKP